MVFLQSCFLSFSFFCQLFVYFCQLFCLHFQLFVYFCQLFCLHFQLFVYIFSCLFTFVSWFQLFVYFLSADFSCLFTSCQLIFEFLRRNHVFWSLFCHYRCFNTLFTFLSCFVYIFSYLFTISAVCLLFSAEISCLFTSCQLIFEFLCKNHFF